MCHSCGFSGTLRGETWGAQSHLKVSRAPQHGVLQEECRAGQNVTQNSYRAPLRRVLQTHENRELYFLLLPLCFGCFNMKNIPRGVVIRTLMRAGVKGSLETGSVELRGLNAGD